MRYSWKGEKMTAQQWQHFNRKNPEPEIGQIVGYLQPTNDRAELLKRESDYALMEIAIDHLSEEDAKMIVAKFYAGLTLEEIGIGIGLSKERVRQKLKVACVRLREKMTAMRPACDCD